MWRHFVYIHRRASDGKPFYVGKGAKRARDKKQRFERAYTDHARSAHWKRIVAKHGLTVEIVMSCHSDSEAQRQEIRLISEIGRLDLKRGPLVNRTDGGDGHAGIIVSQELRTKRRINSIGPRSAAFIEAIRRARKNGGNGGVVKHGDKLPDAWVANLAAAKVGKKNPMYGKISPRAKPVRNVATGATYPNVEQAAQAEGFSAKALYQYLDGSRRNYSPLVRA